MQPKKNVNIINFAFCTLLIALVFVLIKSSMSPYTVASETKDMQNHFQSDKKAIEYKSGKIEMVKEEQDEQGTITHEEIVELTDQFMDVLVQDIDENYKVVAYNSKEELLGAFEEVTTRDVAKIYVDFYYEENEGGLYIIPTETPPWFMEENPYDMVQLNNEEIKVTQTNKTLFYDTYSIEFKFNFDKRWKIVKITHL